MPITKKVNYFILILNYCAAVGILILSHFSLSRYWENLGKLSGDFSVVLLAVTLFPGILKRFGLAGRYVKIHSFLFLTRRQTGIAVYLSALAHTLWLFVLPNLSILPYRMSDWMGAVAFIMFTPLFITSNNFSQKLLKKNWYRIHNLTHFAIWFIFMHLILKKVSWITIFLTVVLILDVLSWIRQYGLFKDIFGYIQKRAGKNGDEPKD